MNLGALGVLSALLLPPGGWPLPFTMQHAPVAEARRRARYGGPVIRVRGPLVPGLADCIRQDLKQHRHPPRRSLFFGDRRSRAERKATR